MVLATRLGRKKTPEEGEILYAGFKVRLFAMFLDTTIIMLALLLMFPGMTEMRLEPPAEVVAIMEQAQQDLESQKITQQEFDQIYREQLLRSIDFKQIVTDSVIQFIVGTIFIMSFWFYKAATPGKMLLGIKIVDADSMEIPSKGQLIKRYLGYIISTLPLCLGFITVAFNKKKQGWHDKLANTLVIYSRPYSQEWEDKKFKYQTVFFTIVIILMIMYTYMRSG